MGIRLFIAGAIVLVVFGIIGAAGTSGQLFGVAYIIWFMASFLSFLTDIALGGWGWTGTGFGRTVARTNTPTQPVT